MPEPLFRDLFFHDGRGPELHSAHWRDGGRVLSAIDYYNPDVTHDVGHLNHVAFSGVQVVQITPEEVRGVSALADPQGRYSPAAMFNLGKDDWFQRFNAQHLGSCSHYQLVFYDELLDVICEGVTCHRGPYQ
jgi:hypothetical protein